ncbi:MAG TPA: hypothetical protein VHP11_01210, partial [Tepidisphaeraceae bacterium]|nr:hypothetical protein [Tepidisphaeraceae bacterium]
SNAVYVADGAAGLKIFAVEESGEPRSIGHCSTLGEAKGVGLAGNYAYVADGPGGLSVIDISNPTNAQRVADTATSGEANALLIRSNYLFLADGPAGLAVYDIQQPTRPEKIGGWRGAWASGLALAGNHLCLAGGDKGLLVIDISNPVNPVLIGSYDTSGDGYGVAVAGNYAYVADGWAGLEIIDISEGSKPQRVGGYETSGYALRVAIRDQKAYVADSFGIQVLDISTPAWPQLSAEYKSSAALDVTPVEGKLFVSTRSESLVTLPLGTTALHLAPLFSESSRFGFRVTGPAGMGLQLQSSSNLTEWTDWQTLTLDEGATNLYETNLRSAPARFYRASGPVPVPTRTPSIPQIILNTDLGVDGDDIGDLVLLHKLADMGLCHLVATIYALSNPYGAPAMEAINIACGRPSTPVATMKNPGLPMKDYYTQYLAEHFPNTLRHGSNAAPALRTYRQLLAAAAPHSLTIIEAAYLVNLSELVLSGPDDISPLTGEELLNQKVKLLAVAGGDYPSGTEVYFRN